MKWLKAILTFFGTIFLGMFGGQKEKGVRRFGISGLAVAMNWKRGWPLILLIPVLIMGYGERSILMQYLGNDLLVRLSYAFLLSLPFIFYGYIRWTIAMIVLIIAFQIRGGSLGHMGWFGDILFEDIMRYSTLGALISFNIFFYKEDT